MEKNIFDYDKAMLANGYLPVTQHTIPYSYAYAGTTLSRQLSVFTLNNPEYEIEIYNTDDIKKYNYITPSLYDTDIVIISDYNSPSNGIDDDLFSKLMAFCKDNYITDMLGILAVRYGAIVDDAIISFVKQLTYDDLNYLNYPEDLSNINRHFEFYNKNQEPQLYGGIIKSNSKDSEYSIYTTSKRYYSKNQINYKVFGIKNLNKLEIDISLKSEYLKVQNDPIYFIKNFKKNE